MTKFHNIDKQKQKCDPTNEQRADKCFSKVLVNELGCNLPWYPNVIGEAILSTYLIIIVIHTFNFGIQFQKISVNVPLQENFHSISTPWKIYLKTSRTKSENVKFLSVIQNGTIFMIFWTKWLQFLIMKQYVKLCMSSLLEQVR